MMTESTMTHDDATMLGYCVKGRRKRPAWQTVPWERPVPSTGDVIEIEGVSYRVLDVEVAEPGHGWPERHISAYVQRVECCRLQAFPDDWLDLDPPLADSSKYRMLGNAVCVAVSHWLAGRLVAATRDQDAVYDADGRLTWQWG
jgi:site-specific DNA-cytosine methylase